MQKLLFLILPLVLATTGCTAFSLQRHTVNQSMSATDYRYQATLRCLAVVANNPGTLPSYAQLSNGLTSITDSGVLNLTSLVGSSLLFAAEALAFTGSRTPMLQWTVSTATDFTQLEALRCACNWALGNSNPQSEHILADPEVDTSAGPHFGVDWRLARLPPGWLHVGQRCDVPPGTRYAEHCGDTWVWVMPDGMEGLSGFTLVLQDIATLDVEPTDGAVPSYLATPTLVTLWVVQGVIQPKPDETDGTFHGDGNFTKDGKLSFCGKFKTTDDSGGASSTNGPGTAARVCDYAEAPEEILGSEIICEPHCSPAIDPKAPDASSSYSSTLVFRVDRVVRPECKCLIEQRMHAPLAVAQSGATKVPAVDISWKEWMDWTTPYQGQRTGVTPGATTSKPLTTAPGRTHPSPNAVKLTWRKTVFTPRTEDIPNPFPGAQPQNPQSPKDNEKPKCP